jgi:hypothetical protein
MRQNAVESDKERDTMKKEIKFLQEQLKLERADKDFYQ